MRYIQEAPFAVQIELTEGCNLRCPFCGINGIRDKQRTYKFMTRETMQAIAHSIARAKWNARIEFAMHGENTLNPLFLDLVAVLRRQLTRNYFMLETNGSGFLARSPVEVTAKVLSYFKAGLDTVALDQYQNVPWADAARKYIRREELTSAGIRFYEYPRDKGGSPHTRTREKRFVIIAPIDLAKSGTHATLNNHSGSGAPLDITMVHERCAKPFREISIRWDGSVAICCNDWTGLYRIGNVNDTSVEELWQHPRFMAARRKLLYHQRDFGPCLGCNNKSYRIGLLPDKFGRKMMPPPDAGTEKIIRDTMILGPLTTPVPRSWNLDRTELLVQITGTDTIKTV